jgi:hypothetical protein
MQRRESRGDEAAEPLGLLIDVVKLFPLCSVRYIQASSAVVAAFIEVSGVLNSCAKPSSQVDLNSSLACRLLWLRFRGCAISE